ncbi:hypothetical protein L596_016859 [Steinernema carpocapsae]|uniref:Acyltransferase 3 domain-containing protein n=1 Tax=Steinernema carpocapsae TaxID=34508 RepID=A0A4U5NKB6_STECR|nr:hypothetical protein L596_016859 [Steinernema carpocapsae]
MLAISTGANYGTYYKYHLYPTLIHLPGTNDDPKAGTFRDFMFNYSKFNYYAAWIRCLPYIVGMLTGYYLQKFKNKRVKVHPIAAITGWVLATACALGCLFGIFNYMNGSTDWSVFTRASYNNFSRLGWGLSLAFLVVACQKGFGGPIKNIMSLKIFTPLSRISYCAYLVHYMMVYIFIAMWRQPLHYVTIFENYVHMAVACIVISYLFGMVWSLMFEIPFGKLEKMLIEALMDAFARRPKRI